GLSGRPRLRRKRGPLVERPRPRQRRTAPGGNHGQGEV
ncbi:MAG: hypothetical protein AVDCRST_MAG55-103, partial [uncultured Rubrobacteraceae bacterium]